MVINFRRTWSQWIRMHWVVGVSVVISETETRLFKVQSTRWWLFAYIHMLYIESKFKNDYPYCAIATWLDWEV